MMPFMTGNITTTVMQDIQDEKGNSVVVQVFNDGISVRCGDAMNLLEFFGYCFAPFLCLTLATTFVVWYVKDNS